MTYCLISSGHKSHAHACVISAARNSILELIDLGWWGWPPLNYRTRAFCTIDPALHWFLIRIVPAANYSG